MNLLKSTDPEVREFAKELVGYALATSGGRLKSRGYLKFVPAEFLQANGLSEVVNSQTINNNLLNTAQLTEIVRHNPDLAPKYRRGTPRYRDAFVTVDGQLHVMKEAQNLRGHVRIGNQLYAPASLTAVETTVDGIDMKVYPLKPVTPLGDYLSDEYNTKPLPLNHLPTKKRPKSLSFATALEAPPNTHDEAPGEYDVDLPDGVVLPDPPVMVPTGPQVPTVDGPPAGVGLGPNPKSAVNDRVVRTEDKLLESAQRFPRLLEEVKPARQPAAGDSGIYTR